MKRWIAILAMGFCLRAEAQTFSEWFFQNKTQINYLHKQIAALAVFIHDLDKGYTLVQAGTGLIGGLQKEGQDQHRDYFTSLMTARPAVVNDPRVASIRDLADRIGEAGKACRTASADEQWLRRDEADFIQNRIKGITNEVSGHLVLLDKLLGGGYWEMSDAERMERIDDIRQAMESLLRYTLHLRDLVNEVITYREWDWEDAEGLMNYYEKRS